MSKIETASVAVRMLDTKVDCTLSIASKKQGESAAEDTIEIANCKSATFTVEEINMAKDKAQKAYEDNLKHLKENEELELKLRAEHKEIMD